MPASGLVLRRSSGLAAPWSGHCLSVIKSLPARISACQGPPPNGRLGQLLRHDRHHTAVSARAGRDIASPSPVPMSAGRPLWRPRCRSRRPVRVAQSGDSPGLRLAPSTYAVQETLQPGLSQGPRRGEATVLRVIAPLISIPWAAACGCRLVPAAGRLQPPRKAPGRTAGAGPEVSATARHAPAKRCVFIGRRQPHPVQSVDKLRRDRGVSTDCAPDAGVDEPLRGPLSDETAAPWVIVPPSAAVVGR